MPGSLPETEAADRVPLRKGTETAGAPEPKALARFVGEYRKLVDGEKTRELISRKDRVTRLWYEKPGGAFVKRGGGGEGTCGNYFRIQRSGGGTPRPIGVRHQSEPVCLTLGNVFKRCRGRR